MTKDNNDKKMARTILDFDSNVFLKDDKFKHEIEVESYSLVMLQGDFPGKQYKIGDNTAYLIGRAPECIIRLNDAKVSRQHAVILVDLGRVFISDLNSTNGIIINGRKVPNSTIKDGDIIKIGRSVFKLVSELTPEFEFYSDMYNHAVYDALTGLYNRYYFMGELKSEISRSVRHRRPLSVVIIDFDNFKSVNDNYGHLAGDSVLKSVADLIVKRKRFEDTAARFGGDEFVMILPETNSDGCRVICEQLRVAVAEGTIVYNDFKIKVSLSIGGASLNKDCRTPKSLLEAADSNLYDAKKSGKNRVIC